MKGVGNGVKGLTLTEGSPSRLVPKARMSQRAMKARAYSQAPALNRKERRAQAKARKLMGEA